MSRRIQRLYIGCLLVGGIFVLVYKGPGHEFIRSYMGDWLVVQLIYLLLRLWIAPQHRFWVAGGVLLIAIGVEIIQFATAGTIPRTTITELTLGSTFDPGDIAAYTLGLVTILFIDIQLSRSAHIS